jgi:hypothetical protein
MTPRRIVFTVGDSVFDGTFGSYGRASLRVRERRESCVDFQESRLDSVRTCCLMNLVEIRPIFLAAMVRWFLADPRAEAVIVDLVE